MGLFSGITSALSSAFGGGQTLGAIGSALDGGLPLLSAGLSFLGGQETNSANADIARQQEEFQAQQYATRYQTTTKDMMAAGLNPMLAYSQGPGSSPSGAAIAMQNPVVPAVNSAANVEATQSTVDQQAIQNMLTKAQISTANSQTALNAASAIRQKADANLSSAQAVNAVAQLPGISEKSKADAAEAAISRANSIDPVGGAISSAGDLMSKFLAPVTHLFH